MVDVGRLPCFCPAHDRRRPAFTRRQNRGQSDIEAADWSVARVMMALLFNGVLLNGVHGAIAMRTIVKGSGAK